MKVFGLFGEKLSHSLSPAIHNMIYSALGMEASYSLFEIQPAMLPDAVKALKTLNINGVNVTIPYKVKIMDYLDDISKEAVRIGAVNTIHNQCNHLKGYNTDYIGFGRMLDKNSIQTQNKSAIVLGTGGAAKSVITYLEDHGVSNIYIVSRDPKKATTFEPNKYKLVDYDSLADISSTDILVNCTPCGMYPKIDCSPLEKETVSRFSAVVDLIYNPSETLLLKYAKQNNIKAVNGLYMLIAQAVAAVEIWTDQTIDSSIINEIHKKLMLNLSK